MASFWTVCLSILDGHYRSIIEGFFIVATIRGNVQTWNVLNTFLAATLGTFVLFWSSRIRTKQIHETITEARVLKNRHLKQPAGGGAIHFSRGQGLLGRRWRRGGKISRDLKRGVWSLDMNWATCKIHGWKLQFKFCLLISLILMIRSTM